jgi:hypothetical protein
MHEGVRLADKFAVGGHHLKKSSTPHREAFFVVVAHPLFDFITGNLQLVGANHHLFAIQP